MTTKNRRMEIENIYPDFLYKCVWGGEMIVYVAVCGKKM